jgi:hypothetical protein
MSERPLWDWKDRQERAAERAAAERSKTLRGTAIRLLVGSGVAAGLWWLGHPKVATVALAFGIAFFLAALLAPSLSRRMEHTLDLLVGAITKTLSFFLVGLVLYLVLTPLGLVLRAAGKLRISLVPPSPATGSTSNWRDIPAVATDSYRRLF